MIFNNYVVWIEHIFNISFIRNYIKLNSDFRNENRIINHKQLGGQPSLWRNRPPFLINLILVTKTTISQYGDFGN